MATVDTYYTGESIPLTITITDKDGNAVDLDTLDEITITIFHKYSRVVMAIFTLTGLTVTKTDAANGVCDIILNGTDTTGEQTGIYCAQADTEETDADYTPLRYRYGQTDAFILKASV